MYFDILIVSDLHCASEALCSEMLALCLSLSYILSKQDFSRYILHFPCHRPGVFYRDSWASPLAWRPDFPGAPREAH